MLLISLRFYSDVDVSGCGCDGDDDDDDDAGDCGENGVGDE